VLQVFHEIVESGAVSRTPPVTEEAFRRLEQKQWVDIERSRISRDLHDVLGPTLTQIKLLGELLELEAARPEQVTSHARLVSAKARQLADDMDEIVWAVNPQKDHLENLAFYLGRYTEQFLELADLHCRLDIPDVLPEIPLPAPVRHRLFLAVKEALNNAVKHAGATEVQLSLAVEGYRKRQIAGSTGTAHGNSFD